MLKSHNHKRLSSNRTERECLLYNDKRHQATYLYSLPRANRILGIDLKTRWCSEIESPNITGYARLRGNEETYFKWEQSTGGGALVFSRTENVVRNYSRTDGMELGVDLIEFDASKSEATYSGASVQVPALQTLIIIKAWSAGDWTVAPW